MSFVQKKRNNLDELIQMPTKAEERCMVQISLGPMIKSQDRDNPESTTKFTADP